MIMMQMYLLVKSSMKMGDETIGMKLIETLSCENDFRRAPFR